MQIFRIEHRKTLRGAYHSCFFEISDAFEREDIETRHPTPERDSVLMRSASLKFPYLDVPRPEWKPFFFGFSSVAQLRRWFYEDELMETLKRKGLVVNVYEVPPMQLAIGSTQAIFRKEYHKPEHVVKTYELTELPVD